MFGHWTPHRSAINKTPHLPAAHGKMSAALSKLNFFSFNSNLNGGGLKRPRCGHGQKGLSLFRCGIPAVRERSPISRAVAVVFGGYPVVPGAAEECRSFVWFSKCCELSVTACSPPEWRGGIGEVRITRWLSRSWGLSDEQALYQITRIVYLPRRCSDIIKLWRVEFCRPPCTIILLFNGKNM